MVKFERTKIWSHRGDTEHHAENTMPAFIEALKIGVDGIELDVQRSLDGELVICHDENLSRLAGQEIEIAKTNWSVLRKINIAAYKGQRERLPLLSEVLALLQDTKLDLNLELKNSIVDYPGLEEDIMQLTRKSKMEERIIYSSFNTKSVIRLCQLTDPDRCALLLAYLLTRPVWLAENLGLKRLNPHYKILKIPGYAALCQRSNIQLISWTVNRKKDIELMLKKQVFAIISDYPRLALSLAREFKQQ